MTRVNSIHSEYTLPGIALTVDIYSAMMIIK